MSSDAAFVESFISLLSRTACIYPLDTTHVSFQQSSSTSEAGLDRTLHMVHLIIKTLHHATYELDEPLDTSVKQLKKHIQSLSGVPDSEQRLIWKGKALSNDLPLSHYLGPDIEGPVTIHVVEKPSAASGLSAPMEGPTVLAAPSGAADIALPAFDHDTFGRLLEQYQCLYPADSPSDREIVHQFLALYKKRHTR